VTALFTAWAPGRVNVIGEHTDYSGGLVLPAAIQLGVTVTVESSADAIALTSVRLGEAAPFAADGSGASAVGWARYGQAVAAELTALGRPARGLVATIDSTVPVGAGLSSSAALEVAVALALCAIADFELEPLELALACQRAELRAVGVPCGILDQASSVLGRDHAAILIDCSTLEHRFVPVPDDAALLVVESGVERSLESSDYGRRRGELERALELVGASRSTDVRLEQLDGLDPLSKRRLRHVVTENARVLDTAAAFEDGDLEAAGRLLLASHASLRDDYEVSIPELDLLVELARESGAYGARLLGGGFGGATIALVDAARADDIGARIAAGYATGAGRETQPLVAVPSAGASVRAAAARS
jgi:galactokinase